MKIYRSILAVAALALAACSTPAAPTLGTQIDRMGRPAVNTALTDPFDIPASVGGATANAVKDGYNANADSSTWVTDYKAQIAFNLAVLDGLDRVCGNQIAAGATAAAGRYNGLATVLADDRLFVNTASGTCNLYLGLEADATHLTTNNGDCGGRTPLEDVVDETYSLLAVGAPSGVTDGIAIDSTLSATAFPFLAAPN